MIDLFMFFFSLFHLFGNLDDCIAVDGLDSIARLTSVERCVQGFQLVDLEHAPLKE